MAELGGLRQSHDPQAGTIEQTRTEEAHPNSMRGNCGALMTPASSRGRHPWTMVGLKPTATDATATDHLTGAEC